MTICKKYSVPRDIFFGFILFIILFLYIFLGKKLIIFFEIFYFSKGFSEWIVFLLLIVTSFTVGICLFKKGYIRWSLFIWGISVLLYSISFISSVLPSIEQRCLGQWFNGFIHKPWTLTFGKLQDHREILLWSPGFFFSIFIGIISILGYEVSKKARDILLTRLTSHNFVEKIGKALNEVMETNKGQVDLIVYTPSIGSITDKKAYESYISPFWEYLIGDTPINYPLRSESDISVRIICLTKLAAWEFFKELGDPSEVRDKFMESEYFCDRFEEKEHIIKIKRRDNLPLTRLAVIHSPKDSIGMFFLSTPRKKYPRIRIQGFLTRDPSVVDTLSSFFDCVFESEEPITRIGYRDL